MASTTSYPPAKSSEPSGSAPEDHSQLDGLSGQKDNQSVDDVKIVRVISEEKHHEQDVSNIGPPGSGEESKENDPQSQTVSPPTTDIDLGKKISRAIEVLGLQIEATLAEHRTDIPQILDIQIENLRKLGNELRGENKAGPNNDEKYNGRNKEDRKLPNPSIKQYYLNVVPSNQQGRLPNQRGTGVSPMAFVDHDYEKVEEVERLCEVSRLTMDDWHKRDVHYGQQRHAIRAYYRSVPPADGSVEQDKPSVLNRAMSPQRVVIDSHLLRDEFEEISKLRFAYLPVYMAPPFKFFLKYHGQIGDRILQLKQQLEKSGSKQTTRKDAQQKLGEDGVSQNQGFPASDSENTADAKRGTPDQEQEATEQLRTKAQCSIDHQQPLAGKERKNSEMTKTEKQRTTRIEYLELLHDFINKELRYYLELQSQVEKGSLTTIAFEDLWYLFQPGEVLYQRSQDHDQLLKTYSVTGGLQRRRNRTREENDIILMRQLETERFNRRRFRYNYADSDEDADSDDENAGKHSIVEASGTWSPFTLDCYQMGFDGVNIGPVDSYRRIKHYNGECKITDLPVYPLRFHKQKEVITAKLEARGRAFINSYGHKSYNGLTIPRTPRRYQEELQGDVFIDLKTYYRVYSRRRPKLGVLRTTRPDPREINEHIVGESNWRMLFDHEVDEKIMEGYMASSHPFAEPVHFELVQDSVEHLQLFPYRIPAFVFRTRAYAHIDIEKVADIDKSGEARDTGFDDLIIPQGHRDLLIALVQNHATGGNVEVDIEELQKTSTQIEIVRGKGRGLIILLHGPPGSGKTSTAETIAAYTRRPLYSITCGDLGTTIREVERNLQEHTDRAHRWGCVLLLDEADVFLMRRDWKDMDRNALVSVFLRELEYYAGILFLTTNRVGVIDEAFKSRIHISLRYPRIQRHETRQIWDNILNRIERNNKVARIKVKFDRASLWEFADKHYRKNEESETTWNGRQIRNAFQTAIALGHYEREKKLKAAGMTAEDAAQRGQKTWMAVRLTKANFRNIAKTASEFDDYLASVRGPDSSLAKENQLRDDTHELLYSTPVTTRRGHGAGIRATATNSRGNFGYLTPSPGKSPAAKSSDGFSPSKRSANDNDNESDDDEDDEDDEDDGDDDDDISNEIFSNE